MITAQLPPLELLSPDDLAAHVREEMNNYLGGKSCVDDRYCLELIRRVATTQDASAWAALYAQFAPLVLSWLLRRARGKEALAVEGSDSLVNASFTKLWMALRPGTKRFNSVGEFLSYLQMCAASVLADWWREFPLTLLPGNEGVSDIHAPDEPAVGPRASGYIEVEAEASDDPADAVIARLSFEELFEIVQNALQGEEERAIGFLSLLCDLSPRAILQERPDLFAGVDDVYRVKRNVIERLQRNKQVRAFLPGKAAAGRVRDRRAHAADRTPAEVGPSSSSSLAAECDLERQRRALAQRDLVTLLEQRALHGVRNGLVTLLEQQALHEARNDLLRTVEEQTRHTVEQTVTCRADGVTYHRQVSYCGKQRCRRCREGLGHGPYWYAYRTANGRTVSVYLGKDLFPIPRDADLPSFVAARRGEAQARQREPEITYHHQVSYCGKQRCRRCREGLGHGPYWYAYRTVNGRTVRTYVGKTRPGDTAASGVPA